MNLTARDIAQLVDGILEGDPGIIITGAAGIDDAGPRDVSFLGNSKYLSKIADTRAGLLLLPVKTDSCGKPVIRGEQPQLAFARVLAVIDRERKDSEPAGVHPTAIIAPTATVGKNCSIGPCAVIEDRASIGDNSRIGAFCSIGAQASVGSECLLYPHVTVRELCILGNRVILHPGVVIGADGFGFAPTRQGHFKIPQIGNVTIGDDVEIGANTTVDRATTGTTKIGRGTKIDNLVQIAHNVKIGEHCVIAAQSGVAGSTRLGNFVTMGGQAGTVGHITVGDGAIIAARAGVIGNVAPKEVVSGYPARPHREALKIQALIHRLPELFDKFKKAGPK
jgi:UDP-3-O-[3-hydroxymyristoyl] glucosamine N-acyltransferase